jgi:hypothetical protein
LGLLEAVRGRGEKIGHAVCAGGQVQVVRVDTDAIAERSRWTRHARWRIAESRRSIGWPLRMLACAPPAWLHYFQCGLGHPVVLHSCNVKCSCQLGWNYDSRVLHLL